MARVVIIGAGVAGLGAALCVARNGHDVVVVERDDTPLPEDPRGAFQWDRHGAPQVRHSHAFLARLRNQLRDHQPDVLAALQDAGATELRFMDMLPEHMDRTPRPGDEDLVALACRRTTFEWVLRRKVLAETGVELAHGTAVAALRGTDGDGAAPLVDGVTLADGSTLDADVVVAAGGRRQDVPAMLAALDVSVEEVTEDTGIIYLSRFFRLLDGAGFPPQVGPIGGDLGYLKYGVFPGDDRTFSITLAVGTHDVDLRRRLLDGSSFLTAAASLTATAAYVQADRSSPVTGVEVMGGLINRRRRFLDGDGSPLVLGFHAVGDAHTATNPLYGRGCSLAYVQAQILADLLERHGAADLDSHRQRTVDYERATEAEITPWYRAAVDMDRMARQAAEAAASDGRGPGSGDDPGSGDVDPATFARSLLRDGLVPAMRVDPIVLRAFLRMFNLLAPPDSMLTDPEIVGRVLAVYQDKDHRPPEPDLGPDRDALLARLGPAR